MELKDLNKITKECIYELQALNIPIRDDELKSISTREMEELGLCEDDGNWKNYKIYVRQDLISDKCPTKILKEIIIHELIHTCPRCFSHGKTFHKYAKMMEDAYGYDLWEMKDDDAVYHQEKPILREFLCPGCHSKYNLRDEEENKLIDLGEISYRCIFCGAIYRHKV